MALLIVAFSANAAERSEAAMRAIAAAKLSTSMEVKGMLGGTKSQMELRCVSNEKAFCVFTPESGDGFVIVAKSDKAEPVIGYGITPFAPASFARSNSRSNLLRLLVRLPAHSVRSIFRSMKNSGLIVCPSSWMHLPSGSVALYE